MAPTKPKVKRGYWFIYVSSHAPKLLGCEFWSAALAAMKTLNAAEEAELEEIKACQADAIQTLLIRSGWNGDGDIFIGVQRVNGQNAFVHFARDLDGRYFIASDQESPALGFAGFSAYLLA